MHLWYVSYGSNLLAERFHTYLTGSDPASPFGSHPAAPDPTLPLDHRWLWIDHALFFAGVSKRWGGASAFVSWVTDESTPSLAHAYLIADDQFAHIAATENGVDSVGLPDDVAVGDWAPLALPVTAEPHRGKYDAVLRLPDIEGVAAWTVTSSIVRERGTPSASYRATIDRGLTASTLPVGRDYLDDAVERSAAITLPDKQGRAAP